MAAHTSCQYGRLVLFMPLVYREGEVLGMKGSPAKRRMHTGAEDLCRAGYHWEFVGNMRMSLE